MDIGPKKTCPICKSRFSTEEPGRDRFDVFCSERCRMADLGHWFSDAYSIDGRPDPDSAPDSDFDVREEVSESDREREADPRDAGGRGEGTGRPRFAPRDDPFE